MESIEPRRKLDLETIKHIPINYNEEKLHCNHYYQYSQYEFDFQLHHIKVITNEY